jgi:type IV secretory pathway VirB2 component (pilin)
MFKKINNKIIFVKDIVFMTSLFVLTQVTVASAQLPWDSTISTVESDMTGTVAKALSVIAVTIAGIGFAHSEDGSWKKTAFKVGLGVTLALAAASWVNVL